MTKNNRSLFKELIQGLKEIGLYREGKIKLKTSTYTVTLQPKKKRKKKIKKRIGD